MRPNLAMIAVAAAATPAAFLLFTDRPEANEEETIASVELAPAEGGRIEIDLDADGLARVTELESDEPEPVIEPQPVDVDPIAQPVAPVVQVPEEPKHDAAAVRAARAAEARALLTLKSIASAQEQVRASGAIDTNGDRVGEFAYLAELAGVVPVRVQGHRGAEHGAAGDYVRPTYLTPEFGDLSPTAQGGASEIDGYLFAVHLPGTRRVSGRVAGLPEALQGGSGYTLPDPKQSALYWCAYAWPVADSAPARRAFFIDASGTTLSMGNDDDASRRYVGHARAPKWSAAYARADMAGELGDDGANDGNDWSR